MEFYSGILGLEIFGRRVEIGGFVDSLTGIDCVEVEWVKLIIPKGGLIELLQYKSHPDVLDVSYASNKLGISHVALTVNNLDELYKDIIASGYTCKSRPLLSPNGKVKILYGHGPDGEILELIEDL